MARALGRGPEDEAAGGTHQLTRHVRGTVGLLLTNRAPEAIHAYFGAELAAQHKVDFARAGTLASRDFSVPFGAVYSTGGEIPAEHDVPLGHTLEPELRRLGLPVRMVRGRVVLEAPPALVEGSEEWEDGFHVCRAGDVLDARQTRLLKLFGVCMSEFRVVVRAYWSAATGEVTVVDDDEEGEGGDAGMDEDQAGSE